MRHPFAPLGMPALIHDKPGNRASWQEHASEGWNLGPSLEHHRCFNLYNKATRSERISGTVFFKHKFLTSPIITPEDRVVEAAQQLTSALQGNVPGSNQQMDALKNVAEVFESIANQKQAEVREHTTENNGIRTYPEDPIPTVAAPAPRVEDQAPRVEAISQQPQLMEPDLN